MGTKGHTTRNGKSPARSFSLVPTPFPVLFVEKDSPAPSSDPFALFRNPLGG